MLQIQKLGLKVFTGSCGEIYLEKCFDKLGYAPSERLKNAKNLSETSLAFLVHPTISEDEMLRNAELIRSILIKATN